jgi:hypothetical protein
MRERGSLGDKLQGSRSEDPSSETCSGDLDVEIDVGGEESNPDCGIGERVGALIEHQYR